MKLFDAMYYLNKAIGWGASPLGILFLGVAVGLVLAGWRGGTARCRACGRWIVGLALAQTWIFSCGVVTRIIGVPLEGDEVCVTDEGESWRSSPPVSAIVLLGGGMGVHAKCGRPEIYSGADRVWTAAKLWKKMKHLPLTVSGGGARGEIAFLVDMGVDTNKLLVIEVARNTEEEARLIKEKISAVNSDGKSPAASPPRIALVTSAWHMPRAKMLFERNGFSVVPAPADFEMHAAAEDPLMFADFLPSADALVRNSYAIKEWVARICYWVKR